MRSPLASPFRGGWRNLTPMRGRGRGGANPWTPAMLPPYAWYDAELGQPKNVGYVELSGVSGDYISTPDSAALSFSTDIEVVMRVRPDDWTAAADQTLAGKYVTTGNQRTWRFYVSTAGAIGLTASANGTAVTSVTVTPTVAMTDATWIWLRMRLDLTDGANSVATLETAADTGDNVEPLSWTANGTNTGVIISGVFDSSAPLEIGSFANGASERLSGRVGRCIVRSGFAGTVVADFNADDCYGDGYTHTDGYRWTLGIPKVYDRSGNNHPPAVFGAGSNQPKWLPWNGSPSVYLPGASGNYVSCPDAAPLRIAGDIEIVARLALDDWTPSTEVTVIAREQAAANRSYRASVLTDGRLNLTMTTDGSTLSNVSSSSAGPWADNTTYWVKVTRRQSDGRVQYFYASDHATEPTGWTQLGTDLTLSSGAAFYSGTSQLEIGSRLAGVTQPLTGRIYRAIVRSGIDGTTVADFDASLCGQSGHTDAYSNVWTVNRATSGRKAVVQSPVANSARSLILHGTDDWIDVPAAAVPALDTFAAASSVAVAFRRWHNPGTAGHAMFSTRSAVSTGAGIAVRLNVAASSTSIDVVAADGTTADSATTASDLGLRSLLTAQVQSASPYVRATVNSGSPVDDTTRATTVTTSTGGAGRVGAYTGGTGAIDMEFESLITRNAATSTEQHAQLVAYYRGGV